MKNKTPILTAMLLGGALSAAAQLPTPIAPAPVLPQQTATRPAAPVVEPHVVMVVATSIVISMAMVAVVMVQMVAAAAHKTDYN